MAPREVHDKIAFKTVPAALGAGHGAARAQPQPRRGLGLRGVDAGMEWMLGREMADDYALAGTLTPRISVLENDAVRDADPAFRQILNCFLIRGLLGRGGDD